MFLIERLPQPATSAICATESDCGSCKVQRRQVRLGAFASHVIANVKSKGGSVAKASD